AGAVEEQGPPGLQPPPYLPAFSGSALHDDRPAPGGESPQLHRRSAPAVRGEREPERGESGLRLVVEDCVAPEVQPGPPALAPRQVAQQEPNERAGSLAPEHVHRTFQIPRLPEER